MYASGFHDLLMNRNPIDSNTVMGMQVYRILHTETTSGTVASSLYNTSKWQAIMANREWFTATVRKRWLKIANYAEPVRDLVGATVTCREGHSFINKDAGCVLHYDSS